MYFLVHVLYFTPLALKLNEKCYFKSQSVLKGRSKLICQVRIYVGDNPGRCRIKMLMLTFPRSKQMVKCVTFIYLYLIIPANIVEFVTRNYYFGGISLFCTARNKNRIAELNKTGCWLIMVKHVSSGFSNRRSPFAFCRGNIYRSLDVLHSFVSELTWENESDKVVNLLAL